MTLLFDHIGEVSALLAALTWAFAVVLFKKSGESVHPIALNLFKNVLAFALFLPTMWFFGESLNRQVPTGELLLFLLSGVLGIGASDTMFFRSLNLIGAGLSAIVDCLYSPFIIGLSVLWLSEILSLPQVVGLALIISAVLTATRKKGLPAISRRDLVLGIFWGVSAMAVMAVGIVMIKPLLNKHPLLWITEIRLLGGLGSLLILLLFTPRRKTIVSSVFSHQGWRYTITGSFVGAFLAMFFWLMGMKFTQASIAAALNQTSNILVFIFAAILLKEPLNLQRIIGILLSVGGAFLVTFG